MSRLIGVARMMDMMMTGRTYGADDGVAIGSPSMSYSPGARLDKGRWPAKLPVTRLSPISP